MDEETEFRLKVYGCELVQEAAVLLRAEQAVACTGQVLLHRFYAKRSLTKFDVERVAATMVFLACKLEECPRRLREVINVFHRMTCRRRGAPLEPLHHLGQEYEDIKQDLIRTERHARRSEFGFCIHVEHPHKFVLNYLRMFELGKDVMQRAWNYANDSSARASASDPERSSRRRRVRAPRREQKTSGSGRSPRGGPSSRSRRTDCA